jgi:hypothetical protein
LAVTSPREPENAPSYGVDVSFPHHYRQISNNYAWLPHNVDPTHHPVPPEYRGMPVQPLGDRQAFYENFLESCEKFYHEKKGLGSCASTEQGRLYMSLKQPKAMQVRRLCNNDFGFHPIHGNVICFCSIATRTIPTWGLKRFERLIEYGNY